MMVRAVFFDLGGTLIDDTFFKERYVNLLNQQSFKKIGITLSLKEIEELRKKVESYLEKKYDGSPVKHKDGIFFFHMCRLFGKKIKLEKAKLLEKHFYEEKLKRIRLMQNCKEVLRDIKRRNIKLILISNGSENRVKRYLNKFRLNKFFDHIVISQKLGKEKSTGYPFKYALKMLNLKPEEVLVVGNKIKEDVIPAKKLGINTVIICKSLNKIRKGKMNSDYQIKNLKEIVRIIDNQNFEKKLKIIFNLVSDYYKKQDTFHNLYHLLSTLKFGIHIAEKEGADKFVVKLGILLHQFHNPNIARKIMKKVGIDKENMKKVEHCIECISRKTIHKARSLEAKVVFDADKLQMLGVLGIIRWCFGKKLNEKIIREAFEVEEKVYKKYLCTRTARKMAKNLREEIKEVKKSIYYFLDCDGLKMVEEIMSLLNKS